MPLSLVHSLPFFSQPAPFFPLPLLLSSSLVQLFLSTGLHQSWKPHAGMYSSRPLFCRSRAPPCLNSPTGTALVRGGGWPESKAKGPIPFVCYPVPYRVSFACQTAIDSPRRASCSLDRQFVVACPGSGQQWAHHPQTFVDPPTPLLFPPIHVWSFASSCGLSRRPPPSCWQRERER